MIPSIWTYDPSLSTNRDKVRFFIGDTNDVDKIFDDGEVDAMLSLESNVYLAAALLADHLSARYANDSSISVDGLSISQGNPSQRYIELAATLRRRASKGLGVIVGGISQSAMDSVDADTDRAPSKFKMGQDSFLRRDNIVERDFNSQ